MQEYQARLRKLSAIAVESIAVPLANEMLANIKNRIVLDGKKTDEGQIGQYSTKSAYFGRQAFDKQSAFKPQKNRKTMFIPDGYKGLRQIQGKPTQFINENYTGSTLATYQQTNGNGVILQGFTTEKSSLIRKGQEAKRGKIFSPSADELKLYNTEFAKGVQEVQVKILRGV